MKTVSQKTIESLRRLIEQMQSGEPLLATEVTRHETPDGPMHTRRMVTIGPQRWPTVPGRIRAQWRQHDVEHREAIAVRRQWLTLLGLSAAEIDKACDDSFDLSLSEELDQLAAAIELAR